jgi:hypothetical protein
VGTYFTEQKVILTRTLFNVYKTIHYERFTKCVIKHFPERGRDLGKARIAWSEAGTNVNFNLKAN